MNDITDGLAGWVLVPKEPTREMWAAMGTAVTGYYNKHHDVVAREVYAAMLASAHLPAPDKLEAGELAADMLVTIARIIARNIDDERFYSAAPFQRAALEIYTAHIEATASQLAAVGKWKDELLNCEKEQRVMRETAEAQLKAAMDRIKVLEGALEKVAEWEMPITEQFWENADGTMSDRPMSFGACYGSNGERDYIRSLARNALSPVQP